MSELSNAQTAHDVLAYWSSAGEDRWFKRDAGFDDDCRARFMPAIEAALAGGLDGWADTPDGALALLIVLDQFTRNVFRGTPRAFAGDARALAVADAAIARGFDGQVDPALRRFFYTPFMHAEDLAAQERSVTFNAEAGEAAAKWARHHRDIVARFGRFPHRNAALGRQSTPEEVEFLASEGAFKG